MSRNYDNWERLVKAVLDREKLRQLARADSLDSLTSDFSSHFSFDATVHPEYVPVLGGLEALKPFSYNELKKAARKLQPLFGEKGWCESKGWIHEHTLTAARPGSGLAITVKLMPKGCQDHNEWLSKVNLLGQLHHPNLVKLIGYCIEGDNRLLVYEFMARGRLDMHLFKRPYQELSNWETRINVAIGVARALCFLHDRKPPVIHGHVKASAILFDKDVSAKLEVFPYVSDDPSAMLSRGNGPHRKLQLAHNWPPEHILTGKMTAKSDVYRFGVVLLQLLSGPSAFDGQRIHSGQNLVNWAKPHLSDKGKLFRIMDPKLREQYSYEGACTLAAIALQCLSLYPDRRPSMTKVLAALEQQKVKSESRE